MNAMIPRIHPSSLGEALMRLDVYMRSYMARNHLAYATLSQEDEANQSLPPVYQREAIRGLNAITDICGMMAPAFELSDHPMTIEFFPQGMALHIGSFLFGYPNRPAVLIAGDLELTFQTLPATISAGKASWYNIALADAEHRIYATSQIDALTRALLLSGVLSGASLTHGETFLDQSHPQVQSVSQEHLQEVEERISRSMRSFRQAAE